MYLSESSCGSVGGSRVWDCERDRGSGGVFGGSLAGVGMIGVGVGGFGGSTAGVGGGGVRVTAVRCRVDGLLEALRSRARRAASRVSGIDSASRVAELLRDDRVLETFRFLAIAVDSRRGRLLRTGSSYALGINAVSSLGGCSDLGGVGGITGTSLATDAGLAGSVSIEADRCRRILLSRAGFPLITICSEVNEGERDFWAR